MATALDPLSQKLAEHGTDQVYQFYPCNNRSGEARPNTGSDGPVLLIPRLNHSTAAVQHVQPVVNSIPSRADADAT